MTITADRVSNPGKTRRSTGKSCKSQNRQNCGPSYKDPKTPSRRRKEDTSQIDQIAWLIQTTQFGTWDSRKVPLGFT